MVDIDSSENSGHLTAALSGKQEDHQLQIYRVQEKLWPENAKLRHVLSTRVNNTKMDIIIFFLSNATTCPCGLRGPPSWAWQQCNRLLRLGRS